MKQVTVYKGRTVILPVALGIDVSQDTITSEIRAGKSRTETLIATWVVTYVTDGTDGDILLTLDNDITEAITNSVGYMDLKRVSGGEPLSVFDEPLQVAFVNTVTA